MELRASLVIDALVRVAVRGWLVAAGDDLAHEVGVVRDRHPEQKEGGTDVELVEEVEHRVYLRRKVGMRPVPVRASQPPVDELVPVLDVEAQ